MPTQIASLAGLAVIVAAIAAIVRRSEVRLTLLLAGLALGALAGEPSRIVRTLLASITDEKFLLPVGSCMGFAYVLKHTGCDRHLVSLLLAPLRRVRFFLVPGAVLVALIVNVPIISQAGTAVAVGAVMIPVLTAARLSPTTIAAALVLGASVGGELLNPGAPELRTVTGATGEQTTACVARIWPLLLIHVGVTLSVFWLLSLKAEAAKHLGTVNTDKKAVAESPPGDYEIPLRFNPFKAVVPLIPLVLLFVAALPGPLRLVTVKPEWLGSNLTPQAYDGRLVAMAMLIGVVVASLTSPSKAGAAAVKFFEGVGYALANVTSLVVAANCFGEGVRALGFASNLGIAVKAFPRMLFPLASILPMAFAWVSGSGFASTESLYEFFVEPARAAGADPLRVGAVVSLSSAAGRTMSPVAAVVLVAASLTGANPIAIVRRLAIPLLAGITAVVISAMLMG